ncbi:MAG: preprotein translocase subunit YajC [Clostridia bacterium]|nr:preprotein translocase subunit YajC [Clostridia bacterium]
MNQFIMLLEGEAPAAYDTTNLIFTFGSLVLFGLVLYFAVIRPQKKREKELKEQLSKLRVGDTVVTIGGLIGRVANIKDDEVTISTSLANTLVTFQKAAVNTVIKPEAAEQTVAKKEKKSKKEEQ